VTDEALTAVIDATLRDSGCCPNGEVAASICAGWVLLSGQIEWDYQKRTILYAVKALQGIAGVTDDIALRYAPISLRSAHF
jgi:osmotically-inducible protein OsmY